MSLLLVYKFYIPTRCLFAGTDKERLCVSKIPSLSRKTFFDIDFKWIEREISHSGTALP